MIGSRGSRSVYRISTLLLSVVLAFGGVPTPVLAEANGGSIATEVVEEGRDVPVGEQGVYSHESEPTVSGSVVEEDALSVSVQSDGNAITNGEADYVLLCSDDGEGVTIIGYAEKTADERLADGVELSEVKDELGDISLAVQGTNEDDTYVFDGTTSFDPHLAIPSEVGAAPSRPWATRPSTATLRSSPSCCLIRW